MKRVILIGLIIFGLLVFLLGLNGDSLKIQLVGGIFIAAGLIPMLSSKKKESQ